MLKAAIGAAGLILLAPQNRGGWRVKINEPQINADGRGYIQQQIATENDLPAFAIRKTDRDDAFSVATY